MVKERGMSFSASLQKGIKVAAAESGKTAQAVVADALRAYIRVEPSILDYQGRWPGKKQSRMVRVDDELYLQAAAIADKRGVSVSTAVALGCEVLWQEGTSFF